MQVGPSLSDGSSALAASGLLIRPGSPAASMVGAPRHDALGSPKEPDSPAPLEYPATDSPGLRPGPSEDLEHSEESGHPAAAVSPVPEDAHAPILAVDPRHFMEPVTLLCQGLLFLNLLPGLFWCLYLVLRPSLNSRFMVRLLFRENWPSPTWQYSQESLRNL